MQAIARMLAASAAMLTVAAKAQPIADPLAARTDFPGSEARCIELAALELPELVTLESTVVPPGPFEDLSPQTAARPAPELPAFCRVRGTVAPEIGFEVWLPFAGEWNGRFQAVGGGGFAGRISYTAMAAALNGSYVTASTDTGHREPALDWLSDPRRLRDYGYRGIFEMTAKAKALIEAFYDRPADYNYFNGCSTGGRQGLMEAQRFPGDYDGIVAGAPVNDFVDTHIAQLWVALVSQPDDDESILDPSDLDAINTAVMDRCDAIDGVTDGLIEDPRTCTFDPRSLQCGFNASAGCLNALQTDALARIYAGPVRSDTGERVHPGLAPGGERTWSSVTTDGLLPIPAAFFSRTVFDDPDWNWRDFDFAEDIDAARETAGPLLDATDPSLDDFRNRGGKLIVYHGWNDPVIFPQASIDYYDSVRAAANAPGGSSTGSTDNFFRLFMVPGMTHCNGGPGADRFDAQAAIEDWVERNIAPDRIEAAHLEGETTAFTRPLCPYPERARYRGTGDRNRAENFVCIR